MKSSIRPAALWDQRYSQDSYAYGREPNAFLIDQYPRLPQGNLLSLGEGQGRNAIFLAKQGYSVTAMDGSAVAMQQTHQMAVQEGLNIETITADLADFEIQPNHWQGIISIYCHLPSTIRRRIHQQVVHGLRPGGVFLLEAFSPAQLSYQTGGPKDPDMLASLRDLQEDLQGLSFLHAQEIERNVQEGLHHHGLASVVQIIGVKS